MERRDLVKSSEISPNLAENLLDLMNIYQIWYILVAKIHRIKLEKPSKLEKIADLLCFLVRPICSGFGGGDL